MVELIGRLLRRGRLRAGRRRAEVRRFRTTASSPAESRRPNRGPSGRGRERKRDPLDFALWKASSRAARGPLRGPGAAGTSSAPAVHAVSRRNLRSARRRRGSRSRTTNEIAQSRRDGQALRALLGAQRLRQPERRKMSKSLGNAVSGRWCAGTIPGTPAGFLGALPAPAQIRRRARCGVDEGPGATARARGRGRPHGGQRARRARARRWALRRNRGASGALRAAMDDDFNTPQAWACSSTGAAASGRARWVAEAPRRRGLPHGRGRAGDARADARTARAGRPGGSGPWIHS
jgi:hypothetical protein